MSQYKHQLTKRPPKNINTANAASRTESADDILAGLEVRVGLTPKGDSRNNSDTGIGTAAFLEIKPDEKQTPEKNTMVETGMAFKPVQEPESASVAEKLTHESSLNETQTKAAENPNMENTGTQTPEQPALGNENPEVSEVQLETGPEGETGNNDIEETSAAFTEPASAPELEASDGPDSTVKSEVIFSDNSETEDEIDDNDDSGIKFKKFKLPKIPIKFDRIKNLSEKLIPKRQPESFDGNIGETEAGEESKDELKEDLKDESKETPPNMSFIEKLKYQTRMRRREQTRLRRENAKRNGNGLELPYQPMTIIDIRFTLIRLGVVCLFLVLGVFFKKHTAGSVFSIIAYLIAVVPILVKVAQNFTHGTYFDEYLLILIASFGAMLLGSRVEASVVLVLHGIGKMANDLVLSSTHKSLARPISLLPDVSSVVNMQGEEHRIAPAEIKPGEFILVRSGERIPIDSVVLRGEGAVDDSALTGNAEPTEIKKGSHVLAGGLYEGSLLLLRSEAKLDDCAVSRVLKIQEESPSKRSGLENSIVDGAEKFIPIIVMLSVLLAVIPPLFHSGTSLSNWIYRALTILFVCCPSVLTIAVPLSFTSGIGHLAQRGIHAKGSLTVEKMAELRMMIFDKTGTLTEGKMRVKQVNPTHDFTQESCLALAAAAEQKSQHPVAKAIVAAAQSVPQKIAEFEEYPGKGVRARIGNRNLLAGNRKLMVSRGVKNVPDIRGTVVYVAYEGDYAGAVILEDDIRPEAEKAIEGLKSQGVLRTVILTGDTETPAQQVADAIGIDTVHFGLLPEEKSSKIEFLLRTIPTDGTSGYVGNGIDDLDELKQADVGIAMGIAGSKETASAADMLIMTNDLSRVNEALRVCRKAHGIALQNMMLALLTKIILVILALLGVASMWQAVSADVLITVLTVLNAARIIGAK